jgi:hypothetical protein
MKLFLTDRRLSSCNPAKWWPSISSGNKNKQQNYLLNTTIKLAIIGKNKAVVDLPKLKEMHLRFYWSGAIGYSFTLFL